MADGALPGRGAGISQIATWVRDDLANETRFVFSAHGIRGRGGLEFLRC